MIPQTLRLDVRAVDGQGVELDMVTTPVFVRAVRGQYLGDRWGKSQERDLKVQVR